MIHEGSDSRLLYGALKLSSHYSWLTERRVNVRRGAFLVIVFPRDADAGQGGYTVMIYSPKSRERLRDGYATRESLEARAKIRVRNRNERCLPLEKRGATDGEHRVRIARRKYAGKSETI
jgi:hypothetical protein